MTIMMMPDGMPGYVDPNSTLGMRLEGWSDFKRGHKRDENPYLKSHPGSLAQKYWFEGWDAATAALKTAEETKL